MSNSDSMQPQFAMLDHMPNGVFVLRQDYVVMFWNRVLEDWTGLARTTIVGTPIDRYFPHLTTPKYAIRIQDVLKHGTPFIFSSYIHKYIIPVTLPNNQLQIQLTMVTRVPGVDDSEFYILFSIQDVTELTQRIDGYRLMRDQAQREVKERQQAEQRLKESEDRLRKAKQAAEAANRAKSIFLANMSHELRTPLNAILGFSQLIARHQALDAEQREYLAIIHRSGEHLLTLINQVLDLSKIEAGKMTLKEQPMNLRRLLDDVIDLFRLRAQEKGLRLLFECAPDVPQYVLADEVKLRQVLINLLGNAIKFTRQGQVTLRILDFGFEISDSQAIQSQIKNLKFEIADTGPGIAPEELAQIFEAFVQTSVGLNTGEGTGLGLSISRKFVQLMRGDLQVESAVGQGSTFSFMLPVTGILAEQLQAPPPARQVIGLAPNQPTLRVVIADDDHDSRQLLLKLLDLPGFETRDVANGQEAIALWQTWQPHLILMDILMPGLDGCAATQEIRRAEAQKRRRQPADSSKQTTEDRNAGRCPQSSIINHQSSIHTVIIAVTAGSFEESQASVLAAGCDDFLRKPLQEADLFAIIARHTGVQYVYEPNTPAETQTSAVANGHDLLRPEIFALLPLDVVDAFEHATLTNDILLMTTLIDRIGAYHAGLADTLLTFVNNFEYLKILTWLHTMKQQHTCIQT